MKPFEFGPYLMLERLAIGGMAEVWLAKNKGAAGFEKLVAVKRILPNISEDQEFINMFVDEAKIAGQLAHANIAQIFDLGKHAGSYYIALEYVPGIDVRSLWERVRHRGGFPLAMACHIVSRLCEGLDYAHRRKDSRGKPMGIVHRDVSPQNVLISFDGDIKIIDFGIAKAAQRSTRTQTGILKGKFAYMAPEQARGQPMDHRADIFAIGVILHELITGERLFRADSDFSLLEKVRKADVQTPRAVRPDTPPELERVVMKALAAKPEDRYPWASAMQADLERYMVTSRRGAGREDLAQFVRDHFGEAYKQEQARQKAAQEFSLSHLKAVSSQTTGPARKPDGTMLYETGEVDPLTSSEAEGNTGVVDEPSLSESTDVHDSAIEGPAPDPDEFGEDMPPTRPMEGVHRDGLRPGKGKPAAAEPPGVRAADRRAQARGEPEEPEDGSATDPRMARVDDQDLMNAVAGATMAEESSPAFEEPPRPAPAPRADKAEKPERPSRPEPLRPRDEGKPVMRPAPSSRPGGGTRSEAPVRAEAVPTRAEAARRDDDKRPDPSAPADRGLRREMSSRSMSAPPVADQATMDGASHAGRSSARRPGVRHDELSFPDMPTGEGGLHQDSGVDEFVAMPTAAAVPISSASPGAAPAAPAVSSPVERVKAQSASAEISLHSANTSPHVHPVQDAPGRGGLKVVAGLVVGMALGVSLMAGLLFSPLLGRGAVVVVTGNERAQVQVDDGPARAGAVVAMMMPAGSRKVTIIQEGYRPDIQVVEVRAFEVTLVSFTATPTRGRLRINTTPVGATVFLDGKKQPGVTPMVIDEMPPDGEHELILKHPETQDEKATVTTEQGKEFNVAKNLKFLVTRVVVDSDPEDASVMEGREFRGKKGMLRVKLGQKTGLKVVRPGCDPQELEVTPKGEPVINEKVTLTCPAFDATVSLESPPGATLAIDGVETGLTLPVMEYRMPVGKHRFEVVTKGRVIAWTENVLQGPQHLAVPER
ncbi:MAG: protein kinase [Deltaproteobacteria bacterium]|nr:protein kinase [Deltaproteobacteria bacterium]